MKQELIKRIKQCPNLPSLPAVAVQLLDLAQRADVDIAQIARTLTKDPALSGKLLRTVNSSFYGRSQHVSTISHALVIMGLQSVKTLVLGFSLVGSLSREKARGFQHVDFWKRSIYAATAARHIAGRLKLVQQEEAFLAALLKDIGMLVLDKVLGEEYGKVCEKAPTHSRLPAAEREALETDHAEVGGMLTEQWKLPPLLTVPITFHHDPSRVADPTLRRLTEVVCVAGACADVFVDESAAQSLALVCEALHRYFRIEPAECDAILKEISRQSAEVATLFEINLGPASSFDAIIKKANETLVELTLQSQQQVNTLQQQNSQLKTLATTDPLTGLFNRGRFDQFLLEAFNAALAGAKPLSLLMLDLDFFKAINDRFGHPNGDSVLKAVGMILKSASRPTDLPVRYGGEEMALVMPGTEQVTAAQIADSIRRAIAAKKVPFGSEFIQVTASFGVAAFEPGGTIVKPEQLLKAADVALYNAKNLGRNCVRTFSGDFAMSARPAAA